MVSTAASESNSAPEYGLPQQHDNPEWLRIYWWRKMGYHARHGLLVAAQLNSADTIANFSNWCDLTDLQQHSVKIALGGFAVIAPIMVEPGWMVEK